MVGVVPVKPDEDWDEEVDALGEKEAEELAEFCFEGFPLCGVWEFAAVWADDFFGWGDEEGEGKAEALQGDEDEVGGVAYFPLFVAVNVEGKLNRGTDELAQLTETKPNTSKLSTVPNRWITERNGSFRSPQCGSSNSTSRTSENHKPFCAVTVVDVQRCGVWCIA